MFIPCWAPLEQTWGPTVVFTLERVEQQALGVGDMGGLLGRLHVAVGRKRARRVVADSTNWLGLTLEMV